MSLYGGAGGNVAENDAPEDEARQLIALEKYMPPDDLSWGGSPTNSFFNVCISELTDSSGISIPGLNVELAVRVPARYHGECKFTFTVFRFRPGGRQRIYQLEVIPESDKGHADDESPCYGPHEHIGKLVQEVRLAHLDCRHHEQWFRAFLQRANIKYGGRYIGPFDGGLFDDV